MRAQGPARYCRESANYGLLKLKPSGRYSFNDKYTGTYVWKPARQRVKFTSGYFSPDFVGIHRHDADDGTAVVYVVLKSDHGKGWRCGA